MMGSCPGARRNPVLPVLDRDTARQVNTLIPARIVGKAASDPLGRADLRPRGFSEPAHTG